MTIPLPARIGALVLATTAFYTYVGQMVPQKEVQPPQETVLRTDMTTADMVKVGREIMDGQGTLPDLPHDRQERGAPVPRPRRGRCPREEPRPGPERYRLLRPIDVRTRRLHRAGIQSGDAPHQQASDRPHRSGDPLRDRVPPDSWRHADGHAPDESPLLHGAGRDAWRLPGAAAEPGEPLPLRPARRRQMPAAPAGQPSPHQEG